MKRPILSILVLVAVFLLGGWLTSRFYSSWGQTHTREEADVMLDRIKTVTKLVTIEGYFSEIYTHEDYYSFNIFPFRKKALLRVKAKASVGFDLSNMLIEAFPEEGKIVISDIPDPQILSIDHDIDYYDLQQGTFNAFTAKDYTEINRKAKEFIRKKAESDEAGLLFAAEEQMNKMMTTIQLMIESSGWKLEFKRVYDDSFPVKLDTLRF